MQQTEDRAKSRILRKLQCSNN
jgi:hypothetical protein